MKLNILWIFPEFRMKHESITNQIQILPFSKIESKEYLKD